METNKKEAIKKAVFIFVLVLLTLIALFVTIKYEIEGEQNPPFRLSKISIISTADGIKAEENKIEAWQVNDIYISIEKNDNYTEKEMIKKVSIENITVSEKPQIGKVAFYKPSSNEGIKYTYEKEYVIKDTLEYFGNKATDVSNLSIANQGGTIEFRSCLKEIGNFEAAENETGYSHDASILQKANVDLEQIKYQIQFDLIIELEGGKKYKANIELDLPNEDLEGQTVKGVEITDLENIVLKRMKF